MSVLLDDGIAGLRSLRAGAVDLILTDPPSGETQAKFDRRVDLAAFWEAAWRVLKPDGVAVLFASSLAFATELRASEERQFRYDLIWAKERVHRPSERSPPTTPRSRIHPRLLPRAKQSVARIWLKLADEGLTWIRGWHEKDSEDVTALMAANMLGVVQAVDTATDTGPAGPVEVTGPQNPSRKRFRPVPSITTFIPRRPR